MALTLMGAWPTLLFCVGVALPFALFAGKTGDTNAVLLLPFATFAVHEFLGELSETTCVGVLLPLDAFVGVDVKAKEEQFAPLE